MNKGGSEMIEAIAHPPAMNSVPSEADQRRERNRRAVAMLQRWLDEPVDERDERCWPLVEEALKSDPIRFGELDETHP
jgi:hypothetical protein